MPECGILSHRSAEATLREMSGKALGGSPESDHVWHEPYGTMIWVVIFGSPSVRIAVITGIFNDEIGSGAVSDMKKDAHPPHQLVRFAQLPDMAWSYIRDTSNVSAGAHHRGTAGA